MPASSRRLALKIDCDTYEGTKNGIPQFLDVFSKHNIRASFFFTLGPDNSGRAIRRIFTQKGFLKKMMRSNAVALYGPKTMMYGTLLPAPIIGEKCADVIRSVGNAGHDVGVHGWDHVRWHDKLDRMSHEAIAHDVGHAHKMFENIFGRKANSSAAPGWHITGTALDVQETYTLRYTSNTRGGIPFFPQSNGQQFHTLEIPSTIPTWDETWGNPRFQSDIDFLNYYTDIIRGTEVHSIHTEVEGTGRFALFCRQLEHWVKAGVQFVTLDDIAREQLASPSNIHFREIKRTTLEGRGGLVSSGI